MKTIELLAPARDKQCGIDAVNCGADAVYIGAEKFSARAAAGNPVADIAALARYAHFYNAKVYAALNTILRDSEMDGALGLIRQLYDAGADGLIIQDMGILELPIPPIPLIASTQCHNDTPEKIKFLEGAGFKRAILARELSLDEIRAIRAATAIELEAFVHGALCVSYSGRCHLSWAVAGRSGNRGDCAQPCRMTYDLLDGGGKTVVKNRRLLSLKDLNLTEHLGVLADAGVCSFKIEGRLKDAEYVKNTVGHYRRRLDAVLEGKKIPRPSSGKSAVCFEPDPSRSFNRGFTEYFINGRSGPVASFFTQKSIGEEIGKVKKVENDFFTIEGGPELHNGDGICFFDGSMELAGTRINRAEGGRIYPQPPGIRFIRPGMTLFRNQDREFEAMLKSPCERKIGVRLALTESGKGLVLTAVDEDGNKAEHRMEADMRPAKKKDEARETTIRQLSKLGGTGFSLDGLEIKTGGTYFLPVSLLNGLRRNTLSRLEEKRRDGYAREEMPLRPAAHPYPLRTLDYTANVLNRKARDFYARHGVLKIEPAAESGESGMKGRKVMTARHCLKYELGLCRKYPKKTELLSAPSDEIKEPLYLSDGRRKFELRFDCANCRMEIFLC